MLNPTSGPHTRTHTKVGYIMGQVIVALFPATLFGFYCFGWSALLLFLVTVVSAVFFEAVCLRLAGREVLPVLRDGSAILTGWLLAMTLPPWAPWWIGVVGSGIAIILAKQVYGGLGQNLFNPAMLARVALLISFPVEMTTWANVAPLFSVQSQGFSDAVKITFLGLENVDSFTGATVLGHVKTELSQNHVLPQILDGYYLTQDAWLGYMRGSMGEVSGLLLLLGGIWLLVKKIITWYIPLTLLMTVAICAGIFHLIDPQHYLSPAVHLSSGAMICVAFFIATDYVTSPNTPFGQMLFGAGCGLLIFIIRTWGGYPEGAGFAVLLMNATTPLIDHYFRPRIYGRNRKGKPIELPD